MSLVFNHRNWSPYLHVEPPRKSRLKLLAAFVVGAACAGVLLQPADSSKFVASPERATSGSATASQAPTEAQMSPVSPARKKSASPRQALPKAAAARSGVSSQDKPSADRETTSAISAAAPPSEAEDEKPDAQSVAPRQPTATRRGAGANPAPGARKSAGSNRESRQVVRILEMPDGRRLMVYQDTVDGAIAPLESYRSAPRRPPAPFRADAPILSR